MTAVHLAALNAGDKVSQAASRMIHSGARMQALLDDMLDFNPTKLGLGIDLSPTNVDLASLFADELNLVRAAHPDHVIDLAMVENLSGILGWSAVAATARQLGP